MLLVCLVHESLHRMLDEGPVWCVCSTCPAQRSVRGLFVCTWFASFTCLAQWSVKDQLLVQYIFFTCPSVPMLDEGPVAIVSVPRVCSCTHASMDTVFVVLYARICGSFLFSPSHDPIQFVLVLHLIFVPLAFSNVYICHGFFYNFCHTLIK